jgi:hypothetical protein
MNENLPRVTYAREVLPTNVTKALFLAGPTPRGGGYSWRTEALSTLEKLGYNGDVFVPEPRDGKWDTNYVDLVEWEEAAMHAADCIVFWMPRDLDGATYGVPMPAFTTNDEWGVWKASGKVVWGAPEYAELVRYQEHYADKLGVPHSGRRSRPRSPEWERGRLVLGVEPKCPCTSGGSQSSSAQPRAAPSCRDPAACSYPLSPHRDGLRCSYR